jgi:hypothetical protein
MHLKGQSYPRQGTSRLILHICGPDVCRHEGLRTVLRHSHVPTVTAVWRHPSRTANSFSDFSIYGSEADDNGTEHRLERRKGGGKGGKGKGKGQRTKNSKTEFGKAFEGLKNAESAIIARLWLIVRTARMLARGSNGTASAGLPSCQEVRDYLNDLQARYLLHLTTNKTGDGRHYNMILESLDAVILESEQSVDRQKVGEFLSEWDATVAWLEGEQESGSTMTRPSSAISVVLVTAAGLVAGSFL